MNKSNIRENKNTSWENSANKYHKIVGEDGHYYHKEVILPKALELLDIKDNSSILDLGCGQGIFARAIPKNAFYVGLDASKSLIKKAKELSLTHSTDFILQDVTKPFSLQKKDFSHCVIILALQNMQDTVSVFKNVHSHLASGGEFLIVLNHPVFRIPKQTAWGIDETNKIQYRKINKYMTPLKIPIDMSPGNSAKKDITWSFHYPISYYINKLSSNGFRIKNIEEWVSNKTSAGKHARMENKAREEFPMFMAIVASK